MNPIVCRRMRKRGIRIVDLANAEEASDAKWPKGLFICRCFDVLDLAAKTVRTFFDEGELMAFLGESRRRFVCKKSYLAIDNACGLGFEKKFPTIGGAVDWLTRSQVFVY